jgi:hypothetical protein
MFVQDNVLGRRRLQAEMSPTFSHQIKMGGIAM